MHTLNTSPGNSAKRTVVSSLLANTTTPFWLCLSLAFFAGCTQDRSTAATPFTRSGFSPAPELASAVPNTVYLEELTSSEVAQLIHNGTSQIIVPTGGIEQNGPFVPLNKHQIIARQVSAKLAQRLGNTLVAPVMDFVPEGARQPASGHMRYAGTISIDADLFVRLLQNTVESLATHGFRSILLVGDSGDNQPGLLTVEHWASQHLPREIQVKYLRSFYCYEQLRAKLQQLGYAKNPTSEFHEDLAFTAQLAALAPSVLRLHERHRTGQLMLDGADFNEFEKIQALGQELIEMRISLILAELHSKQAS